MSVVSLEARRRAVVTALRSVADAPEPGLGAGLAAALQERLDALGSDVQRVLARLDALEQLVRAGFLDAALAAEEPEATPPPVPPLAVPSRGFSPRASRALFGD